MNDTVAVRGIAKNGPIVKYSTTENTRPNSGCTRFPKSRKPLLPDKPIARIPMNGKPIAVTRKPIKAHQNCVPAICPSSIGKIKFPAPKNIPNNIVPMMAYVENGTFACIFFLLMT